MPTLIEMVRASVWGRPTPQPAAPLAENTQVAPVREALAAAGVRFHPTTSDAKLAQIHAAFVRSGLSGEGWNALSKEDRAKHYRE